MQEKNAMEHNATVTETRKCERSIEHTISQAFRTAHLLTASIQGAESAVLEAIDSFDPDSDTEEALLPYVLHAAVQSAVEHMLPSALDQPKSTEPLLPVELQAVLNLSPNLRRCFVLRFLAGVPVQACARLLHLDAGQVDEYSCAALRCLAGFDP